MFQLVVLVQLFKSVIIISLPRAGLFIFMDAKDAVMIHGLRHANYFYLGANNGGTLNNFCFLLFRFT